MIQIKKTASGFALLITLLVIGVVIAVTLAILELSLKQLQLSVNSRDSEIAFHAANAGLECAQRTRRIASTTIEAGGSLTFRCFGVTRSGVLNNLDGITMSTPPVRGDVRRYQADIQWGVGLDARCSEIDMLTIVASSGAVTATGILAQIPSYGTNSKTCAQGARCTIIAVAGYSSTCANKGQMSTLKREILLEF